MALNVAVQMDPIERINIRGDSTFAILLEAQARGHRLSYYTPDRMALNGGAITTHVQPLQVRDVVGDHFTLGDTHRVALTDFDDDFRISRAFPIRAAGPAASREWKRMMSRSR